MNNYRPSDTFTTAIHLISPSYVTVKGVRKKTYPEDGELIFCSFKTYGGTEKNVNDEKNVNGVYSIEDTANVETWYRPDIKSDCRIKVLDNGAVYEIINEPENINMRNQYCKFKVRRIKGGA